MRKYVFFHFHSFFKFYQVANECLQGVPFDRGNDKISFTMKRLGHVRSASGGGDIRYFGHRRYVSNVSSNYKIILFYQRAISKTIEIIKTLNFRRKSDFHPKKDINDALSGKTEKYLGPMTHRRRKSEGYIDHDYNKVCN